MEKLEKVIAALECCLDSFDACPRCYLNDYDGCRDKLNFDALELLKTLEKKYHAAVEMAAAATEVAAEAKRREGDLISREALIKEIRRIGGHNLCEWETIGVLAMAERIPAVEAEPVVHAHWIILGQRTYGGGRCYTHYCSRCGKHGFGDDERCPECGAYMDEEVADGEE